MKVTEYKRLFKIDPPVDIVVDDFIVCPKCKINECRDNMSWCKECCKLDYGVVRWSKKEITAVYKDNKGRNIYVDQNGNVMDTSVYDRDPRGWKRAGKSTEGYHRTIHIK